MGRTPAFAAAVVLALWACHRSAVAEAKFEIQQDAVSGERRVVVTADHEAETIECWPCVPKASRVYERSTRADKVAVQVYMKRVQQAMAPMIFYIHPEFKAPTDTTRVDVLDRDIRLRTCQGDATETMHVPLVVRRVIHDTAQADLFARRAFGPRWPRGQSGARTWSYGKKRCWCACLVLLESC